MDTPNAFKETYIEDEKDITTIKVRGVLVNIFLDIAPYVYGPYVITDCKGIKQLISHYKNAIYGTMTASLLYYKKFRKSLEYDGYEFNHYDPCVVNNIIKGSHMTVFFHLYD